MIFLKFLRLGGLLFCLMASAEAAVILQYHRFGDERYPSTNVTMPQFQAQLDYLRDNDFTVMALPELVALLQAGEALPHKAVALTVDDAFLSVHEQALPLLRSYNFPVTLFIVPDSHSGGGDYMNWQQLRAAVDSGLVSIGSQTLSHPHLPLLPPAAITQELRGSAEEISTRLGVEVELLAYPYGEASPEVMRIAQELGYRAAFGQHSGALAQHDNFFYLPRFSVNEAYGDLATLADKLAALPLAVEDFSPADPVVGDQPIEVRFRLSDESLKNSARDLTRDLNCYHSQFGLVDKEVIDGTVILRFAEAFAYGRSRLNCTLASRNEEGGESLATRFHWFGWQFVRYGGVLD